MQISNRLPKEKQLKAPKNRYSLRNQKTYQQHTLTNNLESNLSHPKLREMQRYGTLNVDTKAVINSIRNGNAIVISEDEQTIKALVRYSSRYYITVIDNKFRFIKTFLPDNIANFLDYVQLLIDKENATKMVQAA